jgi:ATP-binding cassette subfamily B protein
MTNDIAETKKAYSQLFIQFAVQILTGVGTTVYMFMIEWRMALVAVAGGLITVLVNTYYARKLKKVSREIQEKLATLTEELSNILAGIKVIKSFNLYERILNKFTNKNDEVYHKSYERVNKKALMNGFNALGGMFSFVGLTILGSYLAIRGEITVGVIIGVVQLQNGISMLVRTLGNMISEVQGSLAAADRIYEVLDKKQEPQSYKIDAENDFEAEIEGDKAVVVDSLCFSYENVKDNIADEDSTDDDIMVVNIAGDNILEDEDKFGVSDEREENSGNNVLQNLSFDVSSDSVVALAGPSGGGKSTIFKLLLNFYPPSKGDIIIGGRSITNQSISTIRSKIAYVPQDAYLFAGTIGDNIAYVKKGDTEEELREAAKIANAHQFITEMEKGYKTTVGERGAHLSGGQRQRIAIARAVLKDAEILLLDEATSALDTESEKLVQDALNNLMEGRTTLVIAHRLATIQDADKILVLQDGQIIEKGDHQELLQNEDGVYRRLYYQQFNNNNFISAEKKNQDEEGLENQQEFVI